MLYKVELLCVDRGVFGVVNIRLSLDTFDFKKSQRKRIARTERKFNTVVVPAADLLVTPAMEAMYDAHKHRFEGFVHPTLIEYLSSGLIKTVFDTYQVLVYDGDQLAAVSFFDIGERSMASLIGLQHPDYLQDGLGVFTMLREIQFARERGLRWYYPGYVFDLPSPFDYKLSLGEMEYYTPSKRWGSLKNFNPAGTRAFLLRKEMDLLSTGLKSAGFSHDQLLYPFFSLGYMAHWSLDFVTLPKFVELVNTRGKRLIVGFEPLKQVFVLLDVAEANPESLMIDMDYRTTHTDGGGRCVDILRCRMVLLQTKTVAGVLDFLSAL